MPERRFALPIARPEWTRLSLCHGLDLEIFFAEGRSPYYVSQAKFVCQHCPVRFDCLQTGMSERFGVWGGTVHLDRIKLRRAMLKGKGEFQKVLDGVDKRARKEYDRRFGWQLVELLVRLGAKPTNIQEARLVIIK